MVTSLSHPQRPKRVAIHQHATTHQDLSSFSQSPPNMDLPPSKPGILAQSHGNNPFLSPNTSETWSADDDTGSSSGQDEFHLERYSQDADVMGERPLDECGIRGKLGSGAKKSKRPDLNIVTELPGSQACALETGIFVDEVKAKKAATSRHKSIVSAKAEHVHDRLPAHRSNALAGLKETARLRHERNRTQRDDGAAHPPAQLSAGTQVSIANSSRARDRSNQKPVVIGISIPRQEAEAQKNMRNDDSAITLRTPSIVVTPAEVEPPWTSSPPFRRQKSASDSTAPPLMTIEKRHDKLQKPTGISNFSRPSGLPTIRQDSERSNSSWVRRDSEDTMDGEQEDLPQTQSRRRFSSESKERILPAETDPARHKSQGWWNLMLSPMLSRAGTIKSTMKRSPTTEPPVPPLPSASDRRRSRSATLDSQMSPETPRRLGLASARASTWSRWAPWEKQKNQSAASPAATGQRGVQLPTEHQTQHSGAAIPFTIASSENEGLAAEYYRACAIEQLTSEHYFKCLGHSCAEKLPALRSVFDHATQRESSQVIAGGGQQGSGTVEDIDHHRNVSGSTNALSPEDLSPNIRQADFISVVKAKAIGSETPSFKGHATKSVVSQISSDTPSNDSLRAPPAASLPMPSSSRLQTKYPNIAAIVPPQYPFHSGATVASPGPISPEMQRSMTAQGGVPMAEIRTLQAETSSQRQMEAPPVTVPNYLNNASHEDRRDAPANVHVYHLEGKPSPKVAHLPTSRDSTQEERSKEANEDRPSLFSRLRSCAKARKAIPPSSTATPKKRRWAILIFIALLLMIVGIVALATQLTRRGDQTPTQQQWLNLTGYPPMPTGISTIIRPDLVQQQDQCVSPPGIWSCSLPKEEHSEVAPNNPNQPNFRFEIKFRNGTVPSNMTIPITSSPTNAGNTKRANDPFTNELFTPNPPPPSRAEQIFLGNTTDNITSTLFEGEDTPFYMTLIPTFPIDPNDPSFNLNDTTTSSSLNNRSLLPRQLNLSSAIPRPSIQEDGSAFPANLLPTSPYPFAQPIRLFNRGLQDEHYGFYTFFDKSIFLSASSTSTNTSLPASASDDSNGGALRTQAKFRCTFSQTRFLVRIYTNPAFGASLLPSQTPINSTDTNTNSATNFSPPGSFPYPTDITIDRHGGTFQKKLVYCYAMTDLQVLLENEKSVVREDRGAGGSVVNPAPPIIEVEGQDDGREGFEAEEGGVDGGTGGCECGWRNWV